MSNCIYLRKSRADNSQESEEETLSRHEKILTDFAKIQKLKIDKIYREVASGESIALRPIVQQLLTDIEHGIYSGVLVLELERLGRGNNIDQGIISETFKHSNTKIITPMKTYDLSNDFDDEMSEFGMFMSRREYKTINRRLQRGRKLSVEEGKFLGSVPPYGYERMKLKKGNTLNPNPDEAEIVKLIFELFTTNNMGTSLVANHLNDLKIKPRNEIYWNGQTIRSILTNEVYIGKIRYDYRKTVKKMVNNQLTKSRPRNLEYTLVDGLHQALIDVDTFSRAQEIFKLNSQPRLINERALQNPLANVMKCGKCKKTLIRRPHPKNEPMLICTNKQCTNVGSYLSLVELELIEKLESWLKEYKLKLEIKEKSSTVSDDLKKKSLSKLESELEKADKQIHSLCDFLEKGVYTIEIFQARNKVLTEKKEQLLKDIQTLKSSADNDVRIKENIQIYSHIIDVYRNTDDIKLKNSLLRKILVKAEYFKEKSGRWSDSNDFQLILYPRI